MRRGVAGGVEAADDKAASSRRGGGAGHGAQARRLRSGTNRMLTTSANVASTARITLSVRVTTHTCTETVTSR
eukprot:scaffold7086_cov62-Phaeocystis_antarctica.AAC.5